MAKVKLKVCGMKDHANIGEIAAIRPDFLGFIFYPKSPRFVGLNFSLASSVGCKPVGVFVNETTDNIMRALKGIGSVTAQLHGDESGENCQRLREKGITVIKAIPVGSALDPETLKKYNQAADYFLFDTKGKLYGGNAAKFDWKVLDAYEGDLPFFLSGGIGVDDLGAVSRITSPKLYGVDLNSGVEISPGLKDPQLVRKAKETIDNQ